MAWYNFWNKKTE